VKRKLASAVSSRLEGQIRKVLSLVLLISLIELTANAVAQEDLLTSWSGPVLAVIALVTLATVYSSWLTSGGPWLFLLHGVSVFAVLLLWPVLVSDSALMEDGFKPWIWWGLGFGIMSFGLFTHWLVGGFYLSAVSVAWFVLHASEAGGQATIQGALQDASYLFLFGGSIIGTINLVRRGAQKADLANSAAIASAIEQAKIDAVERERQRLDALIHDRVLNTLLLAAKAKNKSERENAAALALQAISSLREAIEEPRSTPSVTPLGLFRALRKAALQLVPQIEVRTLAGGSEEIPAAEARAITEATLQAIDNASRHSGANRFELILDSPKTGAIEIVVSDNGTGFRPERIPRDRIGIRTSVLGRLVAIGGDARIESRFGSGTKVTLRWPK
jgi:Histidine kinase-, DNA gyrase B-, and HSP90-like ATPase.